MLQQIFKILLNRNVILIGAIILGMSFGAGSDILKDFTIYILGVVMTFSTSGIPAKGLLPISRSLKTIGVSVFLGYFVFSTVLLTLSWLFIDDTYLFYGMVIIAASPPGVAVIPFTHILKGNVDYTMVGTLGTYLASIVLAPIIISVFSGSDSLNPTQLATVMLKIVVLPFLISRVLRHKKVYQSVVKIRGRVIDFGFALIIYTAVGLNRSVFFENFGVLAIISIIFVIAMFGLGGIHNIISKRIKTNKEIAISQNLLLTVKSSGFTASASLAIFGKEAAVPSAIMAVFVLIYLLYLSLINELKKRF